VAAHAPMLVVAPSLEASSALEAKAALALGPLGQQVVG